MGLRCLLGHDFGEPELRREREEDGDEVVTTVTEVKTCARCGETQVVSENTEVTTMEQLADEAAAGAEGAEASGPDPTATGPNVGGDRAAAGEGEPGVGSPVDASADAEPARTDSTVDATTDGDVDDAVIIDDDPTAPGDGRSEDGVEAASAGDGPAVDAEGDGAAADATADETADGDDDGAELLESGPDDEAGSLGGGEEYAEYPEAESAESPADDERDAETDDGVILDEEDEPAADRERGAWPEVDEADDAGAETTPWPDQRGDDEGFSAEVGEGGAGDVEFGGGLTPESAGPAAEDGAAEDGDAEYVEAPERDADEVDGTVEPRDTEAEPADTGTGITRAESPDLQTSTSEAATEYHCPECGMTREADGNSMRAGDICPECKRGYVTERPI
ncbi:hypothetical protein [Halorubrum sp. CBA1229]|uniref:DUF7093 family protein n=1 Tax=Halorubrum sp. CBA1229 TaxID=1853699 RepID=UPI000F3ECA28|nr:hypothetical protein [Halorubrum sp. CBA1229]QKY16576.1 hypothetical protein Hrr1229_006665 [Halorubrum sp. CBA1229]